MSFATEIQSALKTLRLKLDENDHATTFTYRGVAYPCILSSEKTGLVITEGGMNDEILLTAFISKADLPKRPTADSTYITVDSTIETADGGLNPLTGKKGTIRAKTYRIGRVIDPPGNGHWEVDLVSPNKQ